MLGAMDEVEDEVDDEVEVEDEKVTPYDRLRGVYSRATRH